jgi:hypothetical protein
MANLHSFKPATTFVFPPLLFKRSMSLLYEEVASQARMRARRACEDALLQHIHEVVHDQYVFMKLRDALAQPYDGMVSVDLFKFSINAHMKVDGHETEYSIPLLLLSCGRIMRSLNKELGPNFRVVRRACDDAGIGAIVMQFCPGGFPHPAPRHLPPAPIHNPEDEEAIEVPVHPCNRRMSVGSVGSE